MVITDRCTRGSPSDAARVSVVDPGVTGVTKPRS